MVKKFCETMSEALVIDLSRMPSHGREVAVYLRGTKSTRHIPLVFVDGGEEKVAKIRELMPDAEMGAWRRTKLVVTALKAMLVEGLDDGG